MTEKKTVTPSDGPKGLYAKLLVAQTSAHGVGKQGENRAQGYSYARAEDVIEEAQRALHEARLVAYMRPVEVEEREITSQQGSGGLFVTLKAELVIVDPDEEDATASTLIIAARGTGTDYPGDKATYKAMTGAAKYAYSSALGIPFTDDPERDVAGAGGARQPNETEASPAQKRLLTTLFRRAGIADEIKVATVFALAGKPVTKRGAGKILDRIADLPDEKLKGEIDKMIDEAGTRPEGAGLPGDDVKPDEIADPVEAEQASLEESPFTDDPA
jgi:hypothetical protein